MLTFMANIFKKITILIIPFFITSCGPAYIIHDLVSDTSIDKNKLSYLYSYSQTYNRYGAQIYTSNNYSVLKLEINGREVEFNLNHFDQYILKPGIHKIQVMHRRMIEGLIMDSIRMDSINNYVEFEAKPGKKYALSYQDGVFSKAKGDSTILYFNFLMPVIREWDGMYSYIMKTSEKVPLINASYTEFKLQLGDSYCLYNGELLSPSKTAKLLVDGRINISDISGQSEKMTIKCSLGIGSGGIQLQFLPGQYDLSISYNERTAREIYSSEYNVLCHFHAQAGHTYMINPNIYNGQWHPTIDDIITKSP
jgi:hypothetical protein